MGFRFIDPPAAPQSLELSSYLEASPDDRVALLKSNARLPVPLCHFPLPIADLRIIHNSPVSPTRYHIPFITASWAEVISQARRLIGHIYGRQVAIPDEATFQSATIIPLLRSYIIWDDIAPQQGLGVGVGLDVCTIDFRNVLGPNVWENFPAVQRLREEADREKERKSSLGDDGGSGKVGRRVSCPLHDVPQKHLQRGKGAVNKKADVQEIIIDIQEHDAIPPGSLKHTRDALEDRDEDNVEDQHPILETERGPHTQSHPSSTPTPEASTAIPPIATTTTTTTAYTPNMISAPGSLHTPKSASEHDAQRDPSRAPSSRMTGGTLPDVGFLKTFSRPGYPPRQAIVFFTELKWVKPVRNYLSPPRPIPETWTTPDGRDTGLDKSALSFTLREAFYQTAWYLHGSGCLSGTRVATAQVNEFFTRFVRLPDGVLVFERGPSSSHSSAPAITTATSITCDVPSTRPQPSPPRPALSISQLEADPTFWQLLPPSLLKNDPPSSSATGTGTLDEAQLASYSLPIHTALLYVACDATSPHPAPTAPIIQPVPATGGTAAARNRSLDEEMAQLLPENNSTFTSAGGPSVSEIPVPDRPDETRRVELALGGAEDLSVTQLHDLRAEYKGKRYNREKYLKGGLANKKVKTSESQPVTTDRATSMDMGMGRREGSVLVKVEAEQDAQAGPSLGSVSEMRVDDDPGSPSPSSDTNQAEENQASSQAPKGRNKGKKRSRSAGGPHATLYRPRSPSSSDDDEHPGLGPANQGLGHDQHSSGTGTGAGTQPASSLSDNPQPEHSGGGGVGGGGGGGAGAQRSAGPVDDLHFDKTGNISTPVQAVGAWDNGREDDESIFGGRKELEMNNVRFLPVTGHEMDSLLRLMADTAVGYLCRESATTTSAITATTTTATAVDVDFPTDLVRWFAQVESIFPPHSAGSQRTSRTMSGSTASDDQAQPPLTPVDSSPESILRSRLWARRRLESEEGWRKLEDRGEVRTAMDGQEHGWGI